MAELSTDQLRAEIDRAEERGDFVAARRLKKQWFGRIRAAADVDGRSEAEREEWKRKATAGRARPDGSKT
jgi:hypothetical protein